MPDAPVDNPWDFGPALRFLSESPSEEVYGSSHEGFKHDIPELTRIDNTHLRPNSTGLGDFDRLWEFLGSPLDAPPPSVSPMPSLREDNASSDDSSLSS